MQKLFINSYAESAVRIFNHGRICRNRASLRDMASTALAIDGRDIQRSSQLITAMAFSRFVRIPACVPSGMLLWKLIFQVPKNSGP